MGLIPWRNQSTKMASPQRLAIFFGYRAIHGPFRLGSVTVQIERTENKGVRAEAVGITLKRLASDRGEGLSKGRLVFGKRTITKPIGVLWNA